MKSNRRDTEPQRRDPLTEKVIGLCIEVHRELGPGLLESAYQTCLRYELASCGLPFHEQVELPVHYKSLKLDSGYRLDFVIAEQLVVELKAVENLLPVHEAQLLTYLKLSGISVGLLVNFNAPTLVQGLKRMVNNHQPASAP